MASFGSTNSIVPGGTTVDPFHPVITTLPPAPVTPPVTPITPPATTPPVNPTPVKEELAPGTASQVTGKASPAQTPVASTSPTTTAVDTQRQQLEQAQQDYQNEANNVHNAISGLANGSTPLTAGEQAQIDGLRAQFQTLVDEQMKVNKGAQGIANTRGYQSGAAEYDPTFQTKTIGSIVSAGLAKVSDLQVKEASAIASLTQSFRDNDIKNIKTAWDTYQEASKARTDALQKTIDDTAKAVKDAADAKIAADKVIYDTVTKPIQDISLTAAKNGASPEALTAINGAQTVDAAIAAAGSTIQTSTNPEIAQYLFYKQQGGTSSYDDWQKKQDAIANSNAYSKAYATASGAAAGAAAGLPSTLTPAPVGLGSDAKGGSILAHTGLSLAAFNYLTQGTASMSRMTAGQRNAIMSESQKFLNENGIDVSTFQSQYHAYNQILDKNLQRANQTKIMAGEVSGTADALVQAIEESGPTKGTPSAPFGFGINVPGVGFNVGGSTSTNSDMSSLRAANILDLMAGKEVNNKFAQTYSTQLQFMANDLAGYMAAARGASSPELQDQRDAAEVIANGMNKGSITAFKDAINANEAKVTQVVNSAVNSSRRSVWDLFGVGDKFVPNALNSASDTQVQDQKASADKVDTYIAQHPDQLDAVSKLYEGNFNDEQIAEYLSL